MLISEEPLAAVSRTSGWRDYCMVPSRWGCGWRGQSGNRAYLCTMVMLGEPLAAVCCTTKWSKSCNVQGRLDAVATSRILI